MDNPNKFKENPAEENIETGRTPRQYAPGSVVDVNEVVEGVPETDLDLAASDPTEAARQDDLNNRRRTTVPETGLQNGTQRIDEAEVDNFQRNRRAHEREYQVTHHEEAVPNYRDETYRDPGETVEEGQSAEKYDQQKRAVDDGSRFIPRDA